MNQQLPKTALILGHPGHELRVFRFLEIYRPIVYVLTDGSGNNEGVSRIPSTLNVLKMTGGAPGKIFGRFTDKEIYALIRDQKSEVFHSLMEELLSDLKQQGIEMIAGDACEGYNPTHDLCRYMINAISKKLGVKNYDFLLEGPPQQCAPELKQEAIWLHLSEEEFERKLEAAKGYPELAQDLKITLEKYGKAPFLIECLRPVRSFDHFKSWTSELPFYETYAIDKVKSGKYDQVISFEKQVLPLAQKICAFS
jgi:hypothetical protein